MELQNSVNKYVDRIIHFLRVNGHNDPIHFILKEDKWYINVLIDCKGKQSQWGHVSKDNLCSCDHAVTGPKQILEEGEYNELVMNKYLVTTNEDGDSITYKYVSY